MMIVNDYIDRDKFNNFISVARSFESFRFRGNPVVFRDKVAISYAIKAKEQSCLDSEFIRLTSIKTEIKSSWFRRIMRKLKGACRRRVK